MKETKLKKLKDFKHYLTVFSVVSFEMILFLLVLGSSILALAMLMLKPIRENVVPVLTSQNAQAVTFNLSAIVILFGTIFLVILYRKTRRRLINMYEQELNKEENKEDGN